MKIEKDMTIGQICGMEEFFPLSRYFFTKITRDVEENTLEHYGFEKCNFREALERMEELAALERRQCPVVLDIYGQEERERDKEKEEVKLIRMPGQAGRPYVLICPGGAYARLWGLIEGLAVGARLNRMGYGTFVLFYRTRQKPPFSSPLMPGPLEDLARAVAFIGENEERFGVRKEGYAVAGFSAGGHLAAEWGSENHGWRAYGQQAPAALFLGYPSVSTEVFCDRLEELLGAERESALWYLSRLKGEGFTREELLEFSVEHHMDEAYPPVYLTAFEDDPIVPVESSRVFLERLKELGIPWRARIGKIGGHSFGVGDQTEAEGWLEEAVEFWNEMLVKRETL